MDLKRKSLLTLLAVVFAAAVIAYGALALSFYTVASAETDGFEVTSDDVTTVYSEFAEAWVAANNAAQPAAVKMLSDAEISQTLEVASDKNIILDLNGRKLELAASASGAVIYVEGTLTVEDASDIGVITGGKNLSGVSGSYGGGVRVKRGTFYFNGGAISGNSSRNGAGVYLTSGKMVLDGGVICNNTANEYGGGVYLCSAAGDGISPSELEIKSGEIFDNRVINNGSYGGGGVCIDDGSLVTMTNGKITANTTYAESGNPNEHYGMGGGVLINKGVFTMSGGEISANASIVGGGVAVSGVVTADSAVMKLSGGVISGNTGMGGILISDNQLLELSGNPVVKDNAQSNGVNADVLPYSGNVKVSGALTDGARVGAYILNADTPAIKDYGTYNTEPANTYFVSNRDSQYCFALNGADLELKAHDYAVDVEAKAPTCTEKGHSAYRQCSRCTARTQYTETDMTEHSYENGVCTVCGAKTQIYWGISEDGAKLTISGNESDVENLEVNGSFDYDRRFTAYAAPWDHVRENITAVEVVNGASPQKTSCWFFGLANAETVDLSGIDTCNLTDMNGMFQNCYRLKNIVFPESFDTSRVTTMNSLFNNCNALTEITLPDSFDTSNVTDMAIMFWRCESLTDFTFLSSFDTSNVERMENMFAGCKNVTALNLSNFNTANLLNVCKMFQNCSALETLDLSSFDITGVTQTYYVEDIFAGCKKLSAIKAPAAVGEMPLPLPVTYFDANNEPYTAITSAAAGKILRKHTEHNFVDGVCADCGEKVQIYWGVSEDGAKLTISGSESDVENAYVNGSFDFDEKFVDGAPWYVAAQGITQAVVTNGVAPKHTVYWFSGCASLLEIDFSDLDTSNVVDMSNMFSYCFELTSLDLSSFDTSNVTDMYNMFYFCQKLHTVKTPKTMSATAADLPAQFWNGKADVSVMASADAGKTLRLHAEHTYGWVTVTEATCTHAGSKKEMCFCGAESGETAEISALGHDYSTEFTVDKQPTATEKGSKSKHCSRCGDRTEVTEIDMLRTELVNPDENGGEQVIVIYPDGFAHNVSLVVTKIPQESYAQYADAINGEIALAYDVSLQSDGVTVQPDGVLTIKLRIPESLQGKAFKLFRLHEGTASEAEYTVDGDYAVVTTDRLSEFIFTADGSAPAANTLWLILVIILSVIIAGEVGFIAYRQVRKNKSKENKK